MGTVDNLMTPFPHGFINPDYEEGRVPYCVDELDIMRLSAEIRKKPKWEEKFNDPEILTKWQSELEGLSQREDKFNFVIKELAHYAQLKNGLLEVGPVDGTWQADKLVEETLRQNLLSGVHILEDVREWQKDWHPGTDQLVLDLVHPSLFPYVHGRTRVTKESHKKPAFQSEKELDLLYYETKDKLLSPHEASELAFAHIHGLPEYSISKKFQWLPSDVRVAADGTMRFLSYINNLHPHEHRELYTTIESILSKFVPLWENVLTDLRNPRPNRIEPNEPYWYDEVEYRSEDEDEDSEIPRVIKPIKIPTFSAPSPSLREVKLGGRTLQIIVKLANTHLNPAKPNFPGGAWHLEGMANERIVATGIYYYSSENISESKLCFRQAIQEPNYEQGDSQGVATVFGLNDNEPLNQNLGSIITSEGRCIAFPNTLQHQIAPFQLEDTTKPGHRRTLVFFLVDPSVRILSTSRVPPQQLDWFLKDVTKDPTPGMPIEIMQKVIQKLDWPMDLKEAKSHRDELMMERKFFIKNSNDQHFERPFSLCEH